MRVRFFQPTHESETAAHLELTRRVDSFWQRFNDLADALLGGSGRVHPAVLDELSALCSERVAELDAGLCVELRSSADGAEFAVSVVADAEPSLWPLAELAIERAPVRRGLRFGTHRASLPVDAVVQRVSREVGFDLAHAKVRAGFGRGHLMDVVLLSPLVGGATDERALDGAYLATELLLGDAVFSRWIASVEVAPLPRPSSLRVVGTAGSTAGGEPRLSLAELPLAVRAGMDAVHAQLPSEPFHRFCERAEWTLLEVDPASIQAAAARAGGSAARSLLGQADLFHSSTMLPEKTKCFLEGELFASERFSSNGETFCYVKVPREHDDPERQLARRLALEDALNVALVPGGVGCVVGAGMGLGHDYIDLALSELEDGLALVQRTLARCEVPRESWLMFCDSMWAQEWLGIYADSPAPRG